MSAGPKISAVILAAGSGTRMGGVAKALLPADDPEVPVSKWTGDPWRDRRRFIQAIIETIFETLGREVRIVVGPLHGDAIRTHLNAWVAPSWWPGIVENPHPERGMASSVAIGFASLGEDVDAAWLWPVDHPFVRTETLRTLSAALGSHAAVRPTYQGRRGHPPLIARSLFAQLAACANVDGGARTVLASADTLDVEVDDPGILRDIDTPADLEAT